MAKVDNVLIHFLSEDDVTSMDLSIYKDRDNRMRQTTPRAFFLYYFANMLKVFAYFAG